MTEKSDRTGGCLCGAVRFTAHDIPHEFAACHCSMCRKWTGGPVLAAHAEGPVTLEQGDDSLAWFDSSEWAERGFRRTCGTSLFYRLKGETPVWIVHAGTLDDTAGFAFTTELFIDEKPDSYAFTGERTVLTGAEVFAQFAPATDTDSSGS